MPSVLTGLLPQAPAALCDMLAVSHDAVQPPIRAEIFGAQRFAQHGRSLGLTHSAERARLGAQTFFPRLRSNIRVLRRAHAYISVQASTGYDISPAAEWLLDNFHIIEAQLKEIHDGLPRSYFRTLPMLVDEPLAGLPRIYGVAWAFVAHTDGAFNEALLLPFLRAYQETRELNLGEMWALPTTLRVVLVENLRRLAERVAVNKAAREVANLCCDQIGQCGIGLLEQLLAVLSERGAGRVFLAQMAQRLQGARTVAAPLPVLDWLAKALPDAAAVHTQHIADQAADNLSVSNAVTSLRAIGDADWPDLVARSSGLMGLLLGNPVFAAEHGVTRDLALHAIEKLARRCGRSEASVAQVLLSLMNTTPAGATMGGVPGHWLQGAGRPALLHALGLPESLATRALGALHRATVPLYLGAIVLGTVALVAWLLGHVAPPLATPRWLWWVGALLMALPAAEAVLAVMHRLISESARPSHLPRLAFAQGVPAEHRVIVVIPALLNNAAAAAPLMHRLELHHLANPEVHAQFAMLSDWADAPQAQTASDAAVLASAVQEVQALNLRYPQPESSDGVPAAPRFILLHRARRYSATQRSWIGWERKRGKLEMLAAALADPACGEDGSNIGFINLGPASRLASGTAYIVTLDSDTQLPPGQLRELVGVAAHPLNQPRLDATGRRVVSGWGILQPRVATPLPAPSEVTLYHSLFAGQCGIDPYSAASSEVYQDLFDQGSFTGKGLLNVQAMNAVLVGRLPDEQVLSHDLLEGALARCATVTDVTLLEDAPFHADVAASRVHRWTRGDWQLLPFLLNFTRYRLGGINRWKMFDNLRRSLVAPASLALLMLALAGYVLSPWVALSLVAAAFMAGPVLGAVAGLAPSRDDVAKRHFYAQAGLDLARAVGGGLWQLGQLLALSWAALDAVGRALYRLLVSRRQLLEWQTAAAAQARAASTWRALLRQHRHVPLAALALGALLWWAATPWPLLATLVCLAWASAPLSTWWVSRARAAPAASDDALNPEQQAYLHAVARDTWRFFERCIGPDDLHLPPDNLQLSPSDMLARRTSPTNIGLYLLSVVCARQFGWIGSTELVTRLQATLSSLASLQRHRGHFLNWYDTQSGAPLLPMYVSTVDSGNLCGHLLAVAQACLELAQAPFDDRATQRALSASRQRLKPLLARRHKLVGVARAELRWCLADHRAMRRSALRDTLARNGAACATAAGVGTNLGTNLSANLSASLQALAQACAQLAWQADFGFLFHRKRNLFHIGYRVTEQQLDAGFYDLLASESRLTSLLAVAKGEVPVRHWATLGRPFFAVGTRAGLRSWSGSMFEYLMPTLVLAEPQGSVLQDACQAALAEQRRFGAAHGLPWGLSESAHAGRDHTLAYQYAPQGVPRLALRRTPAEELVIAPYATALAAQIAPRQACLNFQALQGLGARGRYGFIEALDCSPAHQAGGDVVTPVNTFMAHHQGMSIVALANVLLGGVAQRWGMASAHIEAVASLLHERTPREVSLLYAPPSGPSNQALQRRAPGLLREVVPGVAAVGPTHVLSNGRYHVVLRANGAGHSRLGTTGITRWRDDALRDAHGSFVYLRWDQHPQAASITQHPAPDPAAHYHATYHAERVTFSATWPEVQAHMTVWVSPEDDIEFRQIELHNLGTRALDMELLSAFEVTLAHPRADEAHPAFSNLFVQAHWQAEEQALVFERRARLETETGLLCAHFIAESDEQLLGVRAQADRAQWQGRPGRPGVPAAHFEDSPDLRQDCALNTGLDPVCALAVHLRIPPQGKARLTLATTASANAGTLQAVVDKYRQASHVQRASLMSATLSGIRLRAMRVSPETFATTQMLTTALVHTLARLQADAAAADGDTCDRRALWRLGISGDRPIVLVSIDAREGLGLVRSLAKALQLWAWGGIECDLVVVDHEAASYQMELQRELAALRDRHTAEAAAAPGQACTALHVVLAATLAPPEHAALLALARLRLHADGRPLARHVDEWLQRHELALQTRLDTATVLLGTGAGTGQPLGPGIGLGVGAGGTLPSGEFDAASGEFRFSASRHAGTPRPWVNVLSNPQFGAQLSEAGGGFTWARNSRLNQLTAWSNDPVADPPSEWFVLQDRRSLQAWSLAPSAWGDSDAQYQVAHGQGISRISHRRGALEVSVTWCVDANTSVKQIAVRLHNHSGRSMTLRLIGMAEWMMGANRSDRASTRTALYRQRLPDKPARSAGEVPRPRKLSALLCSQRDAAGGFGGGTAFLALAGAVDDGEDWTCDRREFFDARGSLVVPDHLGQRAGLGLDPCAALSVPITLPGGQTLQQVFLLGWGESPDAARALATLAAHEAPGERMQAVCAGWDALLGAATVATPDPLFDALVNRWLLYQTVACRLWAKAGFYQAGGAIGYRDQLQDALALAWAAPHMLRAQIVLCASRQFPQGDVQHWWHASTGAGVRTHFSDDLLWLPHACLHYLRCTGDAALLDEDVAFIEGGTIPEGAEDLYEVPQVSPHTASVFEHAARSIDRSLKVGVHGLPLMGTGDWNDGMNRVGHQGRGESVWLGWFLFQVVAGFAPLARARGERERAQRWESAAQGWKAALQGPAWDGQWFKRAFFDDGQPLGSHSNAEGRIDLIAQAWSVLSGAASPALQRMALAAVSEHLVDADAGLVRLLDPPLQQAQPSAGYIQADPPGVRENGGQYAHAGVWALMAQAQYAVSLPPGDPQRDAAGDLAWQTFTYLSPAHRASHPQRAAAYGIEPYVMAGDIYSQPPYVGRGGWSWYTGAAAWLHRAAMESLFGLQLHAHGLRFTPCLPTHWPRAELSLRRGETTLRFIFYRADPPAALLATAAQQAQLLLPGQTLLLGKLGANTTYVVPLLHQNQMHRLAEGATG